MDDCLMLNQFCIIILEEMRKMNKIIISFFTLLILTACAATQEEPVDY